MKRLYRLLVFSIMVSSCNSREKEIPDGGPCSYEDKIYPARLIKLEMNPDSITWNAWFEINAFSGMGKDTISYLRMTNRGITNEQIKTDSIVAGNTYQYVESILKTGSCNPDVRTIRLEKY